MSRMIRPRCDSENTVKNGNTAYGKRKYMCKDYREYFIENPDDRIVSDEIQGITDKPLLEKTPLAGITRVAGVSLSRLCGWRDEKYKSSEKQPEVSDKEKDPPDDPV